MENASKALIIAASVFIALMILGALLLMFNNLSNYQNVGTQTTREAQVIEFNNQYTSYDRKNVRGSDLYSLLNRAIDYNKRKSTAGTGKDEGQYIAYQPMEITFDLNNKRNQFYATTETGFRHLITDNSYTVSGNSNSFENSISNTIKGLEDKYGAKAITDLATGKDSIFIANNSSEDEKKIALESYNKAVPASQVARNWNDLNSHKNDVYQYYEYVQFKRARFDCTSTTYDENNGRILSMNFVFTGKFE